MRYWTFTASFLVSLRLTEALSLKTSEAIVDLGYAKYEGNVTYPKAVAYLGIPYAEPPVGDHRYRAPAPLNATRVRRETMGKRWMQRRTRFLAFKVPWQVCSEILLGWALRLIDALFVGGAGGAGSEDCLKVNVYAPLGAKKGQKLPVIVYFRGGAFVWGSAATTPFDHWVQQVPDVVAVAVYYRLDSFGFLPHPTDDSSLADHNVDSFIKRRLCDRFNGISMHLEVIPVVSPSIGRVLVGLRLSTISSLRITTTCSMLLLLNQFIVFLSGLWISRRFCPYINQSARFPLQCTLRWFPLFPRRQSHYRVSYDCHQRRFRRVPLIVGATSNETLSDEGSSISAALKTFFPALTDSDIAELEQRHPASDCTTFDQQFRAATGESELLCAREIMGGAFAKETDVFIYRFNQPNPTMGVSTVDHAADDYFLFRGSNPGFNGTATFTPLSPTEESFAEKLVAYWTSFVRTGDPNIHKLARSPVWPQFTSQDQMRIVLQEGSVSKSGNFVEAEPEAQSNRCALIARKALAEQN
ncbi:unnamed protein product [Somion occarium]|uniref:Carboxylesterase type B domain-containing protein n=1 Tax=Somion occarium TaxID=3059160 RepID=A0ABP1DQI0_9APHY